LRFRFSRISFFLNRKTKEKIQKKKIKKMNFGELREEYSRAVSDDEEEETFAAMQTE
jgi:hypothetical protein